MGAANGLHQFGHQQRPDRLRVRGEHREPGVEVGPILEFEARGSEELRGEPEYQVARDPPLRVDRELRKGGLLAWVVAEPAQFLSLKVLETLHHHLKLGPELWHLSQSLC